MKRLFLLLLLAVTTSGAAAQTDSLPPFDALLNRAREFVKQGDYASCVKCYEEAEKVFAELPDSLRTQFSDDGELFGGFYYNKACYLSMAGRRKAAVETFEHYADRVIGREEVDFPWICQDSDLDNIRSDKRFRRVLERLSQYGDYKSVLCSAAPYRADSVDTMPRFRYAAPNDRNLVRLRRKFDLDSIAGAGDEISKILNLMTWVHDAVRHDGGSDNPSERNAEAMIELCRREGRGVNCRMLAQILNECYLAMGFKSRFVTCMPRKLFNARQMGVGRSDVQCLCHGRERHPAFDCRGARAPVRRTAARAERGCQLESQGGRDQGTLPRLLYGQESLLRGLFRMEHVQHRNPV